VQKASNLTLRLRRVWHMIENRRAVGVSYTTAPHARRAPTSRSALRGLHQHPHCCSYRRRAAALLEQHGIPCCDHRPWQPSADHLPSRILQSTVPTLNNELYPWHGKLRAIARYLVSRSVRCP